MAILPNFMVIGAGKSGTTSLYEYLKSHPEVFMSPVKETNFFALEGVKMIDPKNDPAQMFHYPWSITNYDAYCSLFEKAKSEKAIGEVSPMYLYSPKAALAIKEMLPDIKLIVILRQPVERLYSRYLHLARENRLPSADFKDALNRNNIWWKRNDLVQEGMYGKHLNEYFKIFPKKQIKVFLYEQLVTDPRSVVEEIYNFIGVDPTYLPKLDDKHNISGFIKNKSLDHLIGQQSIVKETISKLSPQLMASIKSNKFVHKTIIKWRNKNLERPSLSKSLKFEMTTDIYSGDIIELQNLTGKDLSHWLNK